MSSAHSKIVNIYTAKTHISQLVERVAAGEEIVIAEAVRDLGVDETSLQRRHEYVTVVQRPGRGTRAV